MRNDPHSLFQAYPEPIEGCVEMAGHTAIAGAVDRKRGWHGAGSDIDLPLDV